MDPFRIADGRDPHNRDERGETLIENFHHLYEADRTNFDLAADLHRDSPPVNSHHYLPYSTMNFPLQDAIYQVLLVKLTNNSLSTIIACPQ